ncbi:MAG: prepilin-type N-terminal cleavage/methylation domain-containing protein [Candidatus Roizmanbacteria bacterium]|nr:prepilin-type N-terminal cleavage/methylation domain-containing protein [Candidatus Roizmanbacteria bacterium]
MSYLKQCVKRAKGFTLIELIVVIGIIGVLATMSIGSYTSVQRNARNAKRKADMKTLRAALEEYNVKYGSYPNPGWQWMSSEPGDYANYNGGNYIPGLSPEFIDVLPRDPKGGQSTIQPTCGAWRSAYLYLSNGTDYKLLSHCAPEGNPFDSKDPFYDPNRGNYTWQVSSSTTSRTGW